MKIEELMSLAIEFANRVAGGYHATEARAALRTAIEQIVRELEEEKLLRAEAAKEVVRKIADRDDAVRRCGELQGAIDQIKHALTQGSYGGSFYYATRDIIEKLDPDSHESEDE